MNSLKAAHAASLREHLLISAAAGYARHVSELPDKLSAITSATNALEDQKARHALIGGLAVGIRSGVPRATLDVDFAVHTSIDLNGLAACFEECGFKETGRFPHSIKLKHESGEPVKLAIDVEYQAGRSA